MQAFDGIQSREYWEKTQEQVKGVARVKCCKKIFFDFKNQSLASENGIANHTRNMVFA
jgi:hypothetical protein